MDKASIIKDAIEYIQQLQAEERRVLQELRVLDDDTAAAATAQVECCDVDGGLLRREAERAKKMKRAQSVASGAQSAPPPPPPAPPHVEVLELRVSEVGDRVLVVNVTCSKGRDAMARVCRAVEELRLRVITASVTSVAGCLMHTIFVEVRRRQASTSSSMFALCIVCEASTECSAFSCEVFEWLGIQGMLVLTV